MAQQSSIEWTDATWKPVTGCSKIRPGCNHLYPERIANQLHALGRPRHLTGFDVTLQPYVRARPHAGRRARNLFGNSMTVLYLASVPTSFSGLVFSVVREVRWQVFQVLTMG